MGPCMLSVSSYDAGLPKVDGCSSFQTHFSAHLPAIQASPLGAVGYRSIHKHIDEKQRQGLELFPGLLGPSLAYILGSLLGWSWED